MRLLALSVFRGTLAALSLTIAAACAGGDTPTTPPAATPTIAVTATPSSFSAVAGSSASAGLTITRGGGFAEEVALSSSGAPAGMTVAVTPATLSPSGSSGTVVATVATSVAAGAYSVTVIARATTNSRITGSDTLTITVIPAVSMRVAR
jgi:hypothetical protein